jgi:hypothetical protein
VRPMARASVWSTTPLASSQRGSLPGVRSA